MKALFKRAPKVTEPTERSLPDAHASLAAHARYFRKAESAPTNPDVETLERLASIVAHAESCVAEERGGLEQAQRALAEVEGKQNGDVAAAQHAFDESPGNGTADQLASAQRRATIMIEHARGKCAAAEVRVGDAEERLLNARREELRELSSAEPFKRSMRKLAEQAEQHVCALLAIATEIDDRGADALRAERELGRLNGETLHQALHRSTDFGALAGAMLKGQLRTSIGFAPLRRAIKLLGGD